MRITPGLISTHCGDRITVRLIMPETNPSERHTAEYAVTNASIIQFMRSQVVTALPKPAASIIRTGLRY